MLLQRLKVNIQTIFGIEDCDTSDKYPGLPTLVGRNKRHTFEIIKGKVWKKVRNWKGNLLSFGGKEVLIKAIAQAIPTYTMSIFQLPKGLCKELSSMISKFWWGSMDGFSNCLEISGSPHLKVVGGDWIAPPSGQLKLNFGVVVRDGVCVVRVRVAIRNDKGKMLVALSKPLTGLFSSEIGGFLALREGLLLAKFHNIHVQIAEVASPESCRIFPEFVEQCPG
ncbi:hypothetical protein Dsin_030074 [Dipteronia sinensis]|uniref:RNase H type-1 domain-containing protein n=1 Tax=Dipteronia sinensis TaxID=43782 RepID=A0AAD9ZJ95_9ROSI|nr:hypothetical protein Dsin_030074 [Dipteronia sinensis]